jgi:hypothetical protein
VEGAGLETAILHADVAMNSAQVSLVKGDLRGISIALALYNATVENMKQNLMFAFLYNALGIPVAAGVLYPFTGWVLSPMIAALAMSFSSVPLILPTIPGHRKNGTRRTLTQVLPPRRLINRPPTQLPSAKRHYCDNHFACQSRCIFPELTHLQRTQCSCDLATNSGIRKTRNQLNTK